MADRPLPHVDVAGWLLGDLEPQEHAATRAHLAGCDECRAEADELRATADLALASGPSSTPPPGLADRIVDAIAAEASPTPSELPPGMTAEDVMRGRRLDDLADEDLAPRADTDRGAVDVPGPGPVPPTWAGSDPVATDPARGRAQPPTNDGTDDRPGPASTSTRPPGRTDAAGPGGERPAGRRRDRELPRWVRPLAAAAVAAVALVALVVGFGGGPPGVVELDTQLVAAAGDDSSADVVVRRLGTGRAVDVTSETLPILPDGGLYELWFVGPGDTPESPNRVSAGTFHPDEDGRTEVVLHAAVIPDEYPLVVITAEPKDGDPGVNGPEVVRSGG